MASDKDVRRCEKCQAYYDYGKYGEACPHCERAQGESITKGETDESQLKDNINEENVEEGKTKSRQFFDFIRRGREKKSEEVSDKLYPVTEEMFGSGVREKGKDSISEESVFESMHHELENRGGLENTIREIQSSEPKTISLWGNCGGDKPPVGWLVCVQGNARGGTYKIYEGKNTIGRDTKMDIPILGDETISRKHTTIKYEPVKRIMKLLPGEGEGLVYINDEDIDEVTVLKDRDILQIGKTKLMLVCLCREDFSWEDWINEGEMP